LIIFDTIKINLHTINPYISNEHNNIKLNPTYEEHSSIDFLDLKISREHKKRKVDIYRKPTTTDITINFFSNHPIEQKMAAYRYKKSLIIKVLYVNKQEFSASSWRSNQGKTTLYV